jgi:hypothetical protein
MRISTRTSKYILNKLSGLITPMDLDKIKIPLLHFEAEIILKKLKENHEAFLNFSRLIFQKSIDLIIVKVSRFISNN